MQQAALNAEQADWGEDTAPFVTWYYIGLYNGTSLYKSERGETFDAFDFPLK